MRRWVIAAVALASTGALAYVHPFGNPRAERPHGSHALLEHADMPADAKRVLVSKCADCHSSETRWPVYARIAPGSWLIERDVTQARKHLNLSNWEGFSADQQDVMRAKISEQVKRREMPPIQYLVLHWNAKLSDADVSALTRWARGPEEDGPAASGAGDRVRGKQVFEKRCTGCHTIETGTGKEGPSLAGVFGRRAGTLPGFTYSAALQRSGMVWTATSLERWLGDPDAVVPNNNMDFHVSNPEERRDLVAYLKQP